MLGPKRRRKRTFAALSPGGLDVLLLMLRAAAALPTVWVVYALFSRAAWAQLMHAINGNTSGSAPDEAVVQRAPALTQAAALAAQRSHRMSAELVQLTRKGAPSALPSMPRLLPPRDSGARCPDVDGVSFNGLAGGTRLEFRYDQGARKGRLRTVQFRGICRTIAGDICLDMYDEDKAALRHYFVEHMRDVKILASDDTASRLSDGDGRAAGSAAGPDPAGVKVPAFPAQPSDRSPRRRTAPDSRAVAEAILEASSWCFPCRELPRPRPELAVPVPGGHACTPNRSARVSTGAQTDPDEELTPSAGEGDVSFHTGPAMRVALEGCFRSAESEILGALYCLDDAALVHILCQKARDGRSVRIVLDENQVRKPSCSMQLQRMLELVEWGAKLYRLRVGPAFATLHHKLWIVDGSVLISGSVNPTHHGLTCNDEHVLLVRHEEAISSALTHVSGLVARATLVTTAFVSEQIHSQSEHRRSASASARRR